MHFWKKVLQFPKKVPPSYEHAMNTHNQTWKQLLEQQLRNLQWLAEAFPHHDQAQEIRYMQNLVQKRLDQLNAELAVQSLLQELSLEN